MHRVAQFAQPHLVVLRKRLQELRHHAPQRLIRVVIVLELLQLGDHRVPATLRDADREHDEKRIQTGLLHNDSVLGQILGDDRRRNTGVDERTVEIETGRNHRRLNRIEHVEPRRHVAEAMPVVSGLQDPVVTRADAVCLQMLRAPHLEPPRISVLVIDLAHRTPEVERLGYRLFDQRSTAGGLHHCRRHVARSDDRVLRRS